MVFNKSGTLLNAFTDRDELMRFIWRGKLDQIQVLTTYANSWNETEETRDVTKEILEETYNGTDRFHKAVPTWEQVVKDVAEAKRIVDERYEQLSKRR